MQYLSQILLFSLVSSWNEASANTLHLQKHFLLFLQKTSNTTGQIYLTIIVSNTKTVISKHSALVRKTPLLTAWGRTAVNLQWTWFSLWSGAFLCLWLPYPALYQHAARPQLRWKPLLSNRFGSPVIKQKDYPQTYHGSFLFNWQFHFLENLNK